MKKVYVTLFLVAGIRLLTAEESSLGLPSSVPIEVFKMKENQVAFGYIGLNVNINQEDSFYQDKIGNVEFKSHGLIYTQPKSVDTSLGNMFEFSYTAGLIKSELKNKKFFDNGKNYDNSWEKNGFYLGIRPAFNRELYTNKWFTIKNSTSIHTLLYTLEGDFSVNNGTNSYAYDETNYGLAIKPSSVIQFTAYPTKNLGLTTFAGLTTLVGFSYIDYENQNDSFDEDGEVVVFNTGINPVFGYDITYKLFGKYKLSLSSVISKEESDNSMETIVRYTHTF